MKAMVEKTLIPFIPAIEKNSLAVHVEASPPPATLQADAKRLARVLRNLTDNAVHYAPPETAVEIRIMDDGRSARVDYTNLAPDLMAEGLPDLFERFYRGDKSRSRHLGGAGIGLSIVKELVDAHGGVVHV